MNGILDRFSLTGFVSAVRFITIFPIGKPGTFAPSAMIPFFPVVGLILGGMTAAVDAVSAFFFPRAVISFLDILFLTIVTGAFHLDGLADTADGLYGNRPREKALAIMKDSRVGAMGAVALIAVLAAKWTGIASCEADRFLMILIIPGLSRGSMLFGIRFLPYGRPDGGTGKNFFDRPIGWRDFTGLVFAMALVGTAGLRGMWLMLVFAVTTSGILWFYRRRMACITGDMLGAMNEVTEAVLFVAASAGGVG